MLISISLHCKYCDFVLNKLVYHGREVKLSCVTQITWSHQMAFFSSEQPQS